MKKSIIKVTFKDGSIGYYRSHECITSFRDYAKVFSRSYAEGLAEGIKFNIKRYGDVLISDVELEDK